MTNRACLVWRQGKISFFSLFSLFFFPYGTHRVPPPIIPHHQATNDPISIKTYPDKKIKLVTIQEFFPSCFMSASNQYECRTTSLSETLQQQQLQL
ncbi:hypothetical protein L873DRAFT_55746 [Choiromyces venosus 120613-1]|uniref:Uncharacterized protein n=1 Tax=Choiromyces venosus 120613-1 TaxID=1336337 RepID=A0A3N4J5I3_9PEZI|nr:hypothetical protein L873DRAFT_55746 [Choiromyces venosus 120613-1]